MNNPRQFRFAAGVVGLFVASAPGIARAESPSNAGTVTAVAGHVTVARLAASPQPLKFRDTLYWRDVVEAQKDSSARVLLGGKTTVTVRELSRLELREETLAEGARYTVELVRGKVRASVARMLMRPGDQVEVRTRNAVASVRGTDFIVETSDLPVRTEAFGLLGTSEMAQGIGGLWKSVTEETVVVTLSGVVEGANRFGGGGRAERVTAYEAVRVSGRRDPVRFRVSLSEMETYLKGLTPSRPQATWASSSDATEAVGIKSRGLDQVSEDGSRVLMVGLFSALSLLLIQPLLHPGRPQPHA